MIKIFCVLFFTTILSVNSYLFNFPEINTHSISIPFFNISNNTECYNELGCFSTDNPWYSVLRPLPKPNAPDDINTKLISYSRNCENKSVTLWPKIYINDTCYSSTRGKTVFITHGFSSSGDKEWVLDMVHAYLKREDVNLFVVDWKDGSNKANYLQVASNTRIVGAEVARFLKYLLENGLSRDSVHLIGHSLGAHISGYVAKAVTYVDHITALDPAQPGFEKTPSSVRLDKDDATYVDAIHTNTQPFIPLLGFGYIEAIGHSDFYMNGGLSQPGCKTPTLSEYNISGINSISDISKIPTKILGDLVSCSHGRSYIYYIESLLNNYCKFWGKKVGFIRNIINMATSGKIEEWWQKIKHCTPNNCSPVGLESRQSKLRGMFEVITRDTSPYCSSDPKIGNPQ